MAIKRVKKKAHEKLDDDNIERVMAALAKEKPVTQKEACEMLNIAVNGPRLKKIIQEYEDKKSFEKKMRSENRGKPASAHEMTTVIEEYLMGYALKSIGDDLFRSVDFVKRIIEEVGVPQRSAGDSYFSYKPLPDNCISKSFEIGEMVWSSKYGAIAEVKKKYPYLSSDGLDSEVYQIYVYERIDEDKMFIDGKRYTFHPTNTKFGGRYASQAAHELGSLRHLKELGVNLEKAIQ